MASGSCSPPPIVTGVGPTLPVAPAPSSVPVTRLDELLTILRNEDGSGNVDDMVRAIDELEKEVDPSWLPELRSELVNGPGFFVREGVAPAVIKLDGLSALPLLLEAQRCGTAENHDNDGMSAMIADLIERDRAASYAVIRPMLQDKDPGVRSSAAWALGYVAEVAKAAELIPLVSDPSAEVRSAALGSLPSFPKTEEVFAVLTRALDDRAESVRISAIWALYSYKDKRALPLLKAQLPYASERSAHPLKTAIEELER